MFYSWAHWHRQRTYLPRRLTAINLRNTHATRRAATGSRHARPKNCMLIFLDIIYDKYFLPMYSRPNLIYHLTLVLNYNSLGRFLYRSVMPLFSKNLTHCARGIPLKGSRGEGRARVKPCGHLRAVLSSAAFKGTVICGYPSSRSSL